MGEGWWSKANPDTRTEVLPKTDQAVWSACVYGRSAGLDMAFGECLVCGKQGLGSRSLGLAFVDLVHDTPVHPLGMLEETGSQTVTHRSLG